MSNVKKLTVAFVLSSIVRPIKEDDQNLSPYDKCRKAEQLESYLAELREQLGLEGFLEEGEILVQEHEHVCFKFLSHLTEYAALGQPDRIIIDAGAGLTSNPRYKTNVGGVVNGVGYAAKMIESRFANCSIDRVTLIPCGCAKLSWLNRLEIPYIQAPTRGGCSDDIRREMSKIYKQYVRGEVCEEVLSGTSKQKELK